MLAFPMPNDKITDRTVIASAWYTEEPEPRVALLLLNHAEPYWSTALLNLDTGEFSPVDTVGGFIDAAIAYADLGLGTVLEVS